MLTGLGAGQGREVSQSLMTMYYNSQHRGQCHLNIDSVQSGAHWVVLSGGGVDIHLMEDSIHYAGSHCGLRWTSFSNFTPHDRLLSSFSQDKTTQFPHSAVSVTS